MDWLAFVASIVESLAWPVGVVASLFLLRRSIRGLVDRMHSLEVGNIKMSAVGEAMFRLEEKAEEANIPTVPSSSRDTTAEFPTRSEALLEQVEEISKASPSAAIVFAWTEVEKALVRYVRESLPAEPSPERNRVTTNLNMLLEHQKIDQSSYGLLRDMREVRNRAAHPSDNAPVTTDEALEYGKLAYGLIYALDQRMVQGSLKSMSSAPAA